jgi:hypothetical protein
MNRYRLAGFICFALLQYPPSVMAGLSRISAPDVTVVPQIVAFPQLSRYPSPVELSELLNQIELGVEITTLGVDPIDREEFENSFLPPEIGVLVSEARATDSSEEAVRILAGAPAFVRLYVLGAREFTALNYSASADLFKAAGIAAKEDETPEYELLSSFMLGKSIHRQVYYSSGDGGGMPDDIREGINALDNAIDIAQNEVEDVMNLMPSAFGLRARLFAEVGGIEQAFRDYLIQARIDGYDWRLKSSLFWLFDKVNNLDPQEKQRVLASPIVKSSMVYISIVTETEITSFDVLVPPVGTSLDTDAIAYSSYIEGEFELAAEILDSHPPYSWFGYWTLARLEFREGSYASSVDLIEEAKRSSELNDRRLRELQAEQIAFLSKAGRFLEATEVALENSHEHEAEFLIEYLLTDQEIAMLPYWRAATRAAVSRRLFQRGALLDAAEVTNGAVQKWFLDLHFKMEHAAALSDRRLLEAVDDIARHINNPPYRIFESYGYFGRGSDVGPRLAVPVATSSEQRRLDRAINEIDLNWRYKDRFLATILFRSLDQASASTEVKVGLLCRLSEILLQHSERKDQALEFRIIWNSHFPGLPLATRPNGTRCEDAQA